jgi:hypothetical protein
MKLITLFSIYLMINLSQANTSNTNIWSYIKYNCSQTFHYRIDNIQFSAPYLHIHFRLRDKLFLGREQLFNGAGISLNTQTQQIIEATCPDKDQSVPGKTHHFEID